VRRIRGSAEVRDHAEGDFDDEERDDQRERVNGRTFASACTHAWRP
jgi:hypothetical protein